MREPYQAASGLASSANYAVNLSETATHGVKALQPAFLALDRRASLVRKRLSSNVLQLFLGSRICLVAVVRPSYNSPRSSPPKGQNLSIFPSLPLVSRKTSALPARKPNL